MEGNNHQTSSVYTNRLAHRTSAPACLECHQHALPGSGNEFRNTHDETFGWIQCCSVD